MKLQATVNHHVPLKVPKCTERLRANIANKRLLLSVDPFMLLEVSICKEGFATLLTIVTFLPTMYLHMIPQGFY